MQPQLHSQASAFGKVILFGEHSVVYGSPALAAGIPNGIRLSATPTQRGRPLELRIPNWDVDLALRPGADDLLSRALHEVLSHCDGPVTGWRIDGEANIPPAAGCGSSAALSVALAKLALGPSALIETIVEASMAGERVFHGNPSGLDSELATRGGVLRYTRSEGVEPLTFPAFEVVVANTKKSRSTAKMVAEVRARKDRYPQVIDPLLTALGQVVHAATESIYTCNYKSLGELMQVSHEVLSGLGVSCPELDRCVAAALAEGALGAKLTGAGGGGCIVALPAGPAQTLIEALGRRGIEAFAVEVCA